MSPLITKGWSAKRILRASNCSKMVHFQERGDNYVWTTLCIPSFPEVLLGTDRKTI